MVSGQWDQLQRQIRRQHGWMLRTLRCIQARLFYTNQSQELLMPLWDYSANRRRSGSAEGQEVNGSFHFQVHLKSFSIFCSSALCLFEVFCASFLWFALNVLIFCSLFRPHLVGILINLQLMKQNGFKATSFKSQLVFSLQKSMFVFFLLFCRNAGIIPPPSQFAVNGVVGLVSCWWTCRETEPPPPLQCAESASLDVWRITLV